MPKILRIHNSSETSLKGIQQSALVTIDSFDGVADPLSSGGSLSQKPGSSIPSVFARLIFFRMAFGGFDRVDVPHGQAAPVYNQIISQCFDVLEALFNHNENIEVEEFSFNQQMDALRNAGFTDLYDTMQKQRVKFMQNVDIIYLFKQNGQIIGGTSPYSFVFSSPNWQSGLPVKSLLERPSKFREYIYRLYIAYQGEGSMNFHRIGIDKFFDYVEGCLSVEDEELRSQMREIEGSYTLETLKRDYPPYKYISAGGVEREVEILPGLWLHSRNTNEFRSDFFIDSTTGEDFNMAQTPIVLSPESHGNMRYYDDNPWPTDIVFSEEENEDDDIHPRPLPGCNAYRHAYLTAINFFEQKLIALPYPISTERFVMPSIKLDDDYFALLPLKPMFFKYFKIEELDNRLRIHPIVSNKLMMELVIPVRNSEDTVLNTIVLRKQYDLENDVCYLTNKSLKTQLNIGLFPMYKSVNKVLNNYWTMLTMEQASSYKEPRLAFYQQGRTDQLTLDDKYPAKRGSSWYYQIRDFDYLQLRLPKVDDKRPAVNGLVLPRFETVTEKNGNNLYHYAVDFGTTNSHIAFVKDINGRKQAVSFGAKEISMQAAYLNEAVVIRDSVTKEVPDKLRVTKAREFFPQSKGVDDNSYTFPIRTVTSETGVLTGTSDLFANVSVGFHYPKEVAHNDMYKTDLKWDFLNSMDDTAVKRGELFFTELLWMIKNHWMSLIDTDENDYNKFPIIMLTFPLGNSKQEVVDAWSKAYREIFGINYINGLDEQMKDSIVRTKIVTMTESLAPCRKLLNQPDVNYVNGLVNVDIGGGTTDIQYYKKVGYEETYRYDSILFAGDDLWGMACENIPGMTLGESNNFTKYAQNHLRGCKMKVGNEEKSISEISLTGKELINFLLRDENRNFTRLLGRDTDPNSRICRMTLFLHYAAIIYHLTNWLKVNDMAIPATINYSGFGSKYIDMLFQDNGNLTKYTRVLISKFWGADAKFGPRFTVQFEQNPKNVTAEGASLYAYEQTNGTPIPETEQVRHLGYNGYKVSDAVEYSKVMSMETNVKCFFDTFVDSFNGINPTIDLKDIPNATRRVPKLTQKEVDDLKTNANSSFNLVATKMLEQHADGTVQLQESMFVWALKDSLWRVGS